MTNRIKLETAFAWTCPDCERRNGDLETALMAPDRETRERQASFRVAVVNAAEKADERDGLHPRAPLRRRYSSRARSLCRALP